MGNTRSSQRTKHNVDRDASTRTYDGIVFASKLEERYYLEVILPGVESGEITSFELQKPYELQPSYTHDGQTVRAIVYKADFYVEYSDGSSVVIDTKGFADSVAKMKRKMFWYRYPNIDYRWIGFSKMDGGWLPWEDIQKARRQRKKLQKERTETNGKEEG